jgi:hypothetical protein
MQSEKCLLLMKNINQLNECELELLQLARIHRAYEIHYCGDSQIVKIYGPKFKVYDS